MSHVTTIEVEIKDLEALKLAASKLGLEFVEGQKAYKRYGQSVGDTRLPTGFTVADLGKCDHALRLKEPGPYSYEIGVVKSRTGSGYQLLWDSWQGGYGLQEKVGVGAQRLIQTYAGEAAIRAARAKGFRVMSQVVKADGSIHIQLGK